MKRVADAQFGLGADDARERGCRPAEPGGEQQPSFRRKVEHPGDLSVDLVTGLGSVSRRSDRLSAVDQPSQPDRIAADIEEGSSTAFGAPADIVGSTEPEVELGVDLHAFAEPF